MENKHPYLAVTLTKNIFGNMKRGFRRALRPLLPAMLFVATTNPNAGQEHPDGSQSQPSSSIIPIPSTSLPPEQSPPPIPTPIPTSTPTPIPETDPAPMEHTFEEPSPAHQHFSPPHKSINVVSSDSKEEESEAQGRKSQDDPLVSLVQGLVTPSKTTVNASGGNKLDTLEKEEEAKQVHLDSLLAQRIAEEEELNEQQKKKRAQIQFEAQHLHR
ncbi:hypothetical protein Tco_0183340 [Tanacetum coccineum]